MRRGHVRRRASGRWQIIYDVGRDPATGRRRQRSRTVGGTKRDAERELRRVLASVEERPGLDRGRSTVAAYADRWLGSVEMRVRSSTLNGYRACLRLYLVPALGHLRLDDVTPTVLGDLYASLLNSGLSVTTIRNAHAVLRAMFGDALRDGVVVWNPVRATKPPASRRVEFATWTEREVGEFLSFVSGDELEALWRLAAMTGMRRGELLGLWWSDVDLEAGSLVVQRSLSFDGREVQEPKTASSRRVLALDATTVEVLGRRRVWHLEQELKSVGGFSREFVFVGPTGGAWSPPAISARFRRTVERSGLRKIRLHDLRHTWATLALEAGVPAKVVSRRLGHSGIGITLDLYTHASEGLDRDAADAVAAMVDRDG